MKYSFIALTLAFIIGVRSIPFIPACAQQCIRFAVQQATTCETTNYACICQHFSIIQGLATPCILKSCDKDVALSQVFPGTQKLCKNPPRLVTEPIDTRLATTEPRNTRLLPTTEPRKTRIDTTEPRKTRTDTTEPKPTAATTTAVAKPTAPVIDPGNANFTFYSCVSEPSTGRLLQHQIYSDGTGMTIQSCLRRCWNYNWAGVEYGRECWCGNEVHWTGVATSGRNTTDDECNLRCPGDKMVFCGGLGTISLYTRRR